MSPEEEAIREELSAYLDGELSEAEVRRVEEAVRADSDLAAELKLLRATSELVRKLPRRSAPAGLAERVIAQAKQARLLAGAGGTVVKAASWPGRLAVAAAVVAAVGIGAALVLRRPGDGSHTGTPVVPPDVGAIADTSEVGQLAMPKSSIVPLSFVINTDNLAQAQREVERVFKNNSLQRLTAETAMAETDAAAKIDAGGNFYAQTASTARRVYYEVVISPDQLRRIIGELNGIRARQKVEQVPVMAELAYRGVDLALADAPDEQKAGEARLRKGLAVPTASPRPKSAAESVGISPGMARPVRRSRGPAKDSPAGAPGRRATVDARAALETQPAEGVEVARQSLREDEKMKLRSTSHDADGYFPELWRKALVVSGDEILAQQAEPSAAGRELARAQQKRPGEPTPDLAVGVRATNGVDRQARLYSFQLIRRGRATTLASSNVRQLLVILNVVNVSREGR